MKELIGITLGILCFFILSSLVVHRYERIVTSPSPYRQPSQPVPSLPQPPVALDPTVSRSSAEDSPEPQPSAEPFLPPSALPPPQEPVFERTVPLQAAPLAPVSGRPLNTIRFESGCATLTQRGRSALNALIPILQEFPHRAITIHGHADSTGNGQVNQALSQLRADVVRHYLAARGIDESRLHFHGYGSTFPLADNRSATGRQRNRRTEIILDHEFATATEN